jgi:hypothetical protein
VFRLYSALRPPRAVRDLCLTQPLIGTKVDERFVLCVCVCSCLRCNTLLTRRFYSKLIAFGVVNGLIRRVHTFPYVDATNTPQTAASAQPRFSTPTTTAIAHATLPLLDARHSYDAICARLELPLDDVRTALMAEGARVFELHK